MAEWMYAHTLPEDMHPEGCQCGCGGAFDAEDDEIEPMSNEAVEELEADFQRARRLAELLGVDINTVIAALPDDDIVPDELWDKAQAQVRAEGL